MVKLCDRNFKSLKIYHLGLQPDFPENLFLSVVIGKVAMNVCQLNCSTYCLVNFVDLYIIGEL